MLVSSTLPAVYLSTRHNPRSPDSVTSNAETYELQHNMHHRARSVKCVDCLSTIFSL